MVQLELTHVPLPFFFGLLPDRLTQLDHVILFASLIYEVEILYDFAAFFILLEFLFEPGLLHSVELLHPFQILLGVELFEEGFRKPRVGE